MGPVLRPTIPFRWVAAKESQSSGSRRALIANTMAREISICPTHSITLVPGPPAQVILSGPSTTKRWIQGDTGGLSASVLIPRSKRAHWRSSRWDPGIRWGATAETFRLSRALHQSYYARSIPTNITYREEHA